MVFAILRVIFGVLLSITAFSVGTQKNNGKLPKAVYPDDDIPSPLDRAAYKLWRHGVVPYVIGGDFEEKQSQVIKNSMYLLSMKTCVNYTKWTGQKDYVNIVNVPGEGCSTRIGRVGGRQVMYLMAPECVEKMGGIIHVLLLNAGFFHEHFTTNPKTTYAGGDLTDDNIATVNDMYSCPNYTDTNR